MILTIDRCFLRAQSYVDESCVWIISLFFLFVVGFFLCGWTYDVLWYEELIMKSLFNFGLLNWTSYFLNKKKTYPFFSLNCIKESFGDHGENINHMNVTKFLRDYKGFIIDLLIIFPWKFLPVFVIMTSLLCL